MLGFRIRHFCIFVFVQIVAGRIIELEYGYQEIEESIPQNELENKKQIEAIEELCKSLKGKIYIKQIDSYVDCLDSLFEDSREVKLVKRSIDPLVGDEGSGDSEATTIDGETETTPKPTVVVSEAETTSNPTVTVSDAETTPNPILIVSSELPRILKETDENSTQNSLETNGSTPAVPLKESESSSTETPPMFKNGFDEILKKFPSQQLHVNLTQGQKLPEIVKSEPRNESPSLSPNDAKPPIVAGEVAKTGASQEKSSEASANNILLIILGVLGVIGVLAFAFNYVKKKRDDKEVDEVLKLEAEGRELKEMKPLMKNPLTQNGSKSLEYIDAEPQNGNGVETKVEMNHNQEVEQ